MAYTAGIQKSFLRLGDNVPIDEHPQERLSPEGKTGTLSPEGR